MKLIILFFSLTFSLTIHAVEDLTQYRQCFDSHEKKSISPCIVSYGTNIYGKYLELSFINKTYRIKQSKICNLEKCSFEMNENLHQLSEVDMYFLSNQLNKVDKRSDTKIWTCFKKNYSKHRVCFKSI